jgi:hypothetical protein
MIRLGVIAALISLTAAGVTGCGSVPATALPTLPPLAPSAAASTAPPATASPASAAASAPAASAPSPSPSLPSEVKDLEVELPGHVSGLTLSKLSMTGPEFLASGATNQTSFGNLLTTLGKSPTDLAIAQATDASGRLAIVALRISGADANVLLQDTLVGVRQAVPEAVVSQVTAGSKTVTEITNPAAPASASLYDYAKGDTLFSVTTADSQLAVAALALLP